MFLKIHFWLTIYNALIALLEPLDGPVTFWRETSAMHVRCYFKRPSLSGLSWDAGNNKDWNRGADREF